jgi:hypothetical protein
MPLTMTPEYVVAFMENAVVAVSPPHRFLIGLGAWIVVLLRILIPSWLSDAVILLVNDDSAGKKLTKKNK